MQTAHCDASYWFDITNGEEKKIGQSLINKVTALANKLHAQRLYKIHTNKAHKDLSSFSPAKAY